MTYPRRNNPPLAVALLVLTGVATALAASCGVNDVKSYASLKLATAGKAKFLYVTGDLNIKTTTVVSKPLVIAYNSKVIVAAGQTLVLTAQPVHHRRWTAAYGSLFQGLGTVRFGGKSSFWVMPEWFMLKEEAVSGDFSPALDRVKAACKDVSCTIVWTQPGSISKPLALTPRLGFLSFPTGLNIQGNGAVGMDFQAGNYAASKPFMLPTLAGYSTAISAADVAGLRATTNSIAGCTNSMLLKGTVKDTQLEVALQAFVNNGFVSDASTLQNVKLYSAFLTYTSPGQVAAALFQRAPTTITNTKVTYTAIDGIPSPGSPSNPNFAFVRNGAGDGGAVQNLGFAIEAWAGNFDQGAKYADGRFDSLKLYAKMAALLGASTSGAQDSIDIGGSPNIWSSQLFASQAAITETNNRNFQTVKLAFELIPSVWAAGQDVDYYLRHSFLTDSGKTQKVLMSPGPTENGAGQDWLNPGIVVKTLEVLAGQVLKVTLTNAAGKSIAQSQFAGRFVPLDWRLYVGLPGIGM